MIIIKKKTQVYRSLNISCHGFYKILPDLWMKISGENYVEIFNIKVAEYWLQPAP